LNADVLIFSTGKNVAQPPNGGGRGFGIRGKGARTGGDRFLDRKIPVVESHVQKKRAGFERKL